MKKLFAPFINFLLSLAVILTVNPRLALCLIPATGSQPDASTSDITASSTTPTLGVFSIQVNNGNSNQVTGLFAENVFAFPVLQQPEGHPEAVNSIDNTVTQFSLASNYGSLGFLAHNFLSGKWFSNLSTGETIDVVYGDGHYQTYVVSQIRQFQAISPSSVTSNFVDLESGETLTATELFYQTYGIKGNLILQTCISKNGNDSWGRMFIVATPGTYTASENTLTQNVTDQSSEAQSVSVYGNFYFGLKSTMAFHFSQVQPL